MNRLLQIFVTSLSGVALCLPVLSHAQETIAPAGTLIPARTLWRMTAETLSLPGDEKMGMVAGNLLLDVNENLRLGVGTYGAVRGERGGFITLGVAGEIQQPLGRAWSSRAGLFVGAGGGHGGYPLTGGGLMLRGDAGLTYETTGYGNVGFGVSHVRFPWGVIASTQPYLQYEYAFYSVLSPGWVDYSSSSGNPDSEAVQARSNEIAAVTSNYRIPASVVGDTGQAQHRGMQLLGVEWLSYQDERWFIKLESEGALDGENKGYMQILAGGGYRLPLSGSTALKFHAAAGPAGGGGVDTGGGLLLDAGVSLQQNLGARTALELSASEVRAPSRSFEARSTALKLNYQFGIPMVSANAIPWSAMRRFNPEKLRIRVVNQTYFKADPGWRSQFREQPVSNLGVQLDYFVSPAWFITGQGLAAYAGKAGAYMTGQLGMGRQRPLSDRWFAEGEALLGAAGGGGLAVGGGMVVQANAAIGYRWSNFLEVSGTAGRIQALHGDFRANVAGLSLAYRFTGFAGK